MEKQETPLVRGISTQHLLVKSVTPLAGNSFDVGTVTVFTGPNNSGTTQALRDISRLLAGFDPRAGDDEIDNDADQPVATRVIDDLTFVPKLTAERLLAGLTSFDPSDADEKTLQGLGPDLATAYRRKLGNEIRNVLYRPVLTAKGVRRSALGEFMPLRLFFLSPDDRHRVLEPVAARGPLQGPTSLLQELQYASEQTHSRLDEAVGDAFEGLHVLLDDSQRITLSLRATPSLPGEASNLIEAVREFEAMPPLAGQGDGILQFTSVVLSMLLGQGRIILLDHPAAFLHPLQARLLGAWIANHAADLGCQVFVTTRHPQLIEGLSQGRTAMTLVTCAREGGNTTVRPIAPETSRELVRSPLLASQQAISALYADSSVVLPTNEDRAICELIAHQVLGAARVGFYHAHGGANVSRVAAALRTSHVPVSVVVDLDVFEEADAFAQLVQAVTGDPPPQPWLATREQLARHVEGGSDDAGPSEETTDIESFLDQLKDGVDEEAVAKRRSERDERFAKWHQFRRDRLASLPHDLRISLEELIDDMKRKGMFVSTEGSLQRWFAGDAAVSEQANWFASAVAAVDQGRCPADLRAFVANLVAFANAASGPRVARRSHRA